MDDESSVVSDSYKDDESSIQRQTQTEGEEVAWSRPNTSHIKNKMKNTSFFILSLSTIFSFFNDTI
jgi:hypothetical protein